MASGGAQLPGWDHGADAVVKDDAIYTLIDKSSRHTDLFDLLLKTLVQPVPDL